MSSDVRDVVRAAARRGRVAARWLTLASTAAKDAALVGVAAALRKHVPAILAANQRDLDAGAAAGLDVGLLDRLRLTEDRVDGIARGLEQVAGLPDPVGQIVQGSTLPNGLRLSQVRVPMGVVGMVYEARPNVTVDAAGLSLKSGNAVLLRGSSSARHSNEALVDVMRDALAQHDFPVDAIQLLPCDDRSSVQHLITARGLVDLVIPRGGAGLINMVVENATVPTIETGVGNVHVYVDATADLDQAVAITVNSKARRVSVCNSAENLLVHKDIAAKFLPRLAKEFAAAGVTSHADEAASALLAGSTVVPVTEQDWDVEYLSLDIAVRVVDSIDAAIDHIAEHSSGHTEAIVTQDLTAAHKFTAQVDAAAVMVNASTAFTDGEQFGMGAEIGISTQKLHARGPMALTELTTTKWIVQGEGQTRPA